MLATDLHLIGLSFQVCVFVIDISLNHLHLTNGLLLLSLDDLSLAHLIGNLIRRDTRAISELPVDVRASRQDFQTIAEKDIVIFSRSYLQEISAVHRALDLHSV